MAAVVAEHAPLDLDALAELVAIEHVAVVVVVEVVAPASDAALASEPATQRATRGLAGTAVLGVDQMR